MLGAESIETTLRLSAAQEADVLYLLVWEMDFKSYNTTIGTANSRFGLPYDVTIIFFNFVQKTPVITILKSTLASEIGYIKHIFVVELNRISIF